MRLIANGVSKREKHPQLQSHWPRRKSKLFYLVQKKVIIDSTNCKESQKNNKLVPREIRENGEWEKMLRTQRLTKSK